MTYKEKQQKLREIINRSCPDLEIQVPISCPDNKAGCLVHHFELKFKKPTLEHLFRTISTTTNKGNEITMDMYGNVMFYPSALSDWNYNLLLPPLEQKEEVLDSLLEILTSESL